MHTNVIKKTEAAAQHCHQLNLEKKKSSNVVL